MQVHSPDGNGEVSVGVPHGVRPELGDQNLHRGGEIGEPPESQDGPCLMANVGDLLWAGGDGGEGPAGGPSVDRVPSGRSGVVALVAEPASRASSSRRRVWVVHYPKRATAIALVVRTVVGTVPSGGAEQDQVRNENARV